MYYVSPVEKIPPYFSSVSVVASYLKLTPTYAQSMPRGLSESEWERIEKFAATAGYRRSPEMLLPETSGSGRDTSEDDSPE